MDKLKNYFLAAALLGVLYLGTAQMSFGQDLLNGDFTSFTSTATTDTGEGGGLTTPGFAGDTLSDWTNTGYAFVFTNGNAGDISVTGSGGALALRGPDNPTPTLNGLTLPPGGGNVVAMDGAYEVGPISQVVVGLTSGQTYAVSFEWAGAQQNGAYNSATTDSWSVALSATNVFVPNGTTAGSLTGGQTTAVVNNVSHGFTGWMTQTFDFTADNSTETLYFFANGTPTGEPPFALLADVSLTEVPEPKASACWAILFGMLIMVGNRAWRRYQKRSSGNA